MQRYSEQKFCLDREMKNIMVAFVVSLKRDKNENQKSPVLARNFVSRIRNGIFIFFLLRLLQVEYILRILSLCLLTLGIESSNSNNRTIGI